MVFDGEPQSDDSVVKTAENGNGNVSGARFLVRILQYLETPQYLRRRLFPMHNSLKFVVGTISLNIGSYPLISVCNLSHFCIDVFSLQGLLPPLDAPHHVRKHEWSPYREGQFLLFIFL